MGCERPPSICLEPKTSESATNASNTRRSVFASHRNTLFVDQKSCQNSSQSVFDFQIVQQQVRLWQGVVLRTRDDQLSPPLVSRIPPPRCEVLAYLMYVLQPKNRIRLRSRSSISERRISSHPPRTQSDCGHHRIGSIHHCRSARRAGQVSNRSLRRH